MINSPDEIDSVLRKAFQVPDRFSLEYMWITETILSVRQDSRAPAQLTQNPSGAMSELDRDCAPKNLRHISDVKLVSDETREDIGRSLRLVLPRLDDPKLLHPELYGRPVHSQTCGCAIGSRDHPICLLQGCQDMGSFGLFQSLWSRCCRADGSAIR